MIELSDLLTSFRRAPLQPRTDTAVHIGGVRIDDMTPGELKLYLHQLTAQARQADEVRQRLFTARAAAAVWIWNNRGDISRDELAEALGIGPTRLPDVLQWGKNRLRRAEKAGVPSNDGTPSLLRAPQREPLEWLPPALADGLEDFERTIWKETA